MRMPAQIASISLILAVAYVVPANAQAEKPTTENLQSKYLAILKQAGYSPQIDKDGDLMFRFEEGNYYILVDPGDPQYFQLVYPGFWKIENEADRVKAFRSATEASTQTKVAKIYVVKDTVWGSLELYVTDPDDISKFLTRGLSALRAGARTFGNEMRRPSSVEVSGSTATTRTCASADIASLAPEIRQLANALVLIAAAAPGRFESVRGDPKTDLGFGSRVYASQVEIPGASRTGIFVTPGQLPYFSATLISSKDEVLARRGYDKAQKALAAICAAAGNSVSGDKGNDGLPRMYVDRFSNRSAVSVHMYRAKDGDFTVLLSVNSTE